jgi:hypothetical protein
MSDERPLPWWYSGNESEPVSESEPSSESESVRESESSSESTVDWLGLLSGAVRMVDWAAGAVLEPHAAHDDPTEHPDCLVCRTLALISDRAGLVPPTQDDGMPEPEPAEPIRWLIVRD